MGLSSVGRLAVVFEVFTRPSLGTVVLARIEGNGRRRDEGAWRVGGVSVPMLPGEGNGDGWAVRSTEHELSLLVVDGLGHGAEAKKATDAALAVFEGRYDGDLSRFVVEANAALRATRGAAASLCRIVPGEGKVDFVGIGNVEGCLVNGGRSLGLTGRSGTLGMNREAPTAHVVTYPFSPAVTTLVLRSDGVRGYFEFSKHPDLLRHDPSVIAAAIYRDQRRGGDDATVVVVQGGGETHRKRFSQNDPIDGRT